jgi:steroid delta-isomerase-like uncharacterized protein
VPERVGFKVLPISTKSRFLLREKPETVGEQQEPLVFSTREVSEEDYAPHAVVEDSMYPEPFVGREAIMARKGTGIAAIADLKITITNRVAHGNQLSAEWVATGTHAGDLPGMPATGHPFTLRGVTVTIRHDGKIVRESIYYDVSDLKRQIGPDAKL